MFEKALEGAKIINTKLNLTIKEIDEAISLLNEVIERLTTATKMMLDAGDGIFVDDIKQFESSIKKIVKLKKLLKKLRYRGRISC